MGGMCTSMARSERFERARGFSTEEFREKKPATERASARYGLKHERKPRPRDAEDGQLSGRSTQSQESVTATTAKESSGEYVKGAHGRKRAPAYSTGGRSRFNSTSMSPSRSRSSPGKSDYDERKALLEKEDLEFGRTSSGPAGSNPRSETSSRRRPLSAAHQPSRRTSQSPSSSPSKKKPDGSASGSRSPDKASAKKKQQGAYRGDEARDLITRGRNDASGRHAPPPPMQKNPSYAATRRAGASAFTAPRMLRRVSSLGSYAQLKVDHSDEVPHQVTSAQFRCMSTFHYTLFVSR
ncbi:hypothetical protein T484DRAFT_3480753 [Baffinella frigidus]|nr:hypothetical protein T484DRAFT_3480753 [Cryptophyta sp. CCMP2293]